MKKILLTGAAGFIGFHLVKKLIDFNFEIIGLDNINNYYSIKLKYDRLKQLGINKTDVKKKLLVNSELFNNFSFVKADIADNKFIINFMKDHQFNYVINLAAQAGVRYSLENPFAYVKSNVSGFLSILEGSRITNVEHLIYASTSSVYGLNNEFPLSEKQPVEHPISIYAATKKSNELMAHSYSHLYHLPTTGLRFFTVYGPWGRPDMAPFLFTNAISLNNTIKVFNYGEMFRDFTYVDDIVQSINKLINIPPKLNPNWKQNTSDISVSSAPYQVFNIGNSTPIKLMDFIKSIEKELGIEAKKDFLPIQPGDVLSTHSDSSLLEDYIKFKPQTDLSYGVKEFVSWFKNYY